MSRNHSGAKGWIPMVRPTIQFFYTPNCGTSLETLFGSFKETSIRPHCIVREAIQQKMVAFLWYFSEMV